MGCRFPWALALGFPFWDREEGIPGYLQCNQSPSGQSPLPDLFPSQMTQEILQLFKNFEYPNLNEFIRTNFRSNLD